MERTKYPRTFHLSWSQSNTSDDVWWNNTSPFTNADVVVTEKMDGECTTIYPDGHVHARSLDTDHHPSRSWIKKYASEFAHQIPDGLRICGENVFAFHSILYTDLPTYFLVFGIYDRNNVCLSWDDTEEICVCLGLQTVPVLYRGVFDETLVQKNWVGRGQFPTYESDVVLSAGEKREFPRDFKPCEAEGYVVRLAGSFHYDDFSKSTAKFVRAHHVKTDSHWMKRIPFPNLLKDS